MNATDAQLEAGLMQSKIKGLKEDPANALLVMEIEELKFRLAKSLLAIKTIREVLALHE